MAEPRKFFVCNSCENVWRQEQNAKDCCHKHSYNVLIEVLPKEKKRLYQYAYKRPEDTHWCITIRFYSCDTDFLNFHKAAIFKRLDNTAIEVDNE